VILPGAETFPGGDGVPPVVNIVETLESYRAASAAVAATGPAVAPAIAPVIAPSGSPATPGISAAMVNSVSVETPHGFRTFELHSGDILANPADLLVISAPEAPGPRATGMLAEAMQKRFGMAIDVSHIWMNFGAGISVCRQAAPEGLPFRHVLTLRIADAEPSADASDLYDRAVQAAFASIATQEFIGLSFRSIALPVLDRKRIRSYDAAVSALLHQAFFWLRHSAHTEVVRLFVYEREDLIAWNHAMNVTLGRSFVDSTSEEIAGRLCQEIVSKIDRGVLSGPLNELETPLRTAIAVPENICVQTVATFGRKLAEAVTEQLCRSQGLPLKRELMMNIEAVRCNKLVAEWICSYLHSLRVFGNEGVHSLGSKNAVTPSQLCSDDLLTILCAIRSVISFWDKYAKTSLSANG
jgi:hypothetical protein